jgi:hypothetical protein
MSMDMNQRQTMDIMTQMKLIQEELEKEQSARAAAIGVTRQVTCDFARDLLRRDISDKLSLALRPVDDGSDYNEATITRIVGHVLDHTGQNLEKLITREGNISIPQVRTLIVEQLEPLFNEGTAVFSQRGVADPSPALYQQFRAGVGNQHYKRLLENGSKVEPLTRKSMPAVKDFYTKHRLTALTAAHLTTGAIRETKQSFVYPFDDEEQELMTEGLANAEKRGTHRLPTVHGTTIVSADGEMQAMSAMEVWPEKPDETSPAYKRLMDFMEKGASGGGMNFTKDKRFLTNAIQNKQLVQLLLVISEVPFGATWALADNFNKLWSEKLVIDDEFVATAYVLAGLYIKYVKDGEEFSLEQENDVSLPGANVGSAGLLNAKFDFGKRSLGPFAFDDNRANKELWVPFHRDTEKLLVTPKWVHSAVDGKDLRVAVEKNLPTR